MNFHFHLMAIPVALLLLNCNNIATAQNQQTETPSQDLSARYPERSTFTTDAQERETQAKDKSLESRPIDPQIQFSDALTLQEPWRDKPKNVNHPSAVVRTEGYEPQEPNKFVRFPHIDALARELAVSLQNLGEGHPHVKNLRQRISRLQQGLPTSSASITSTNFATPQVIERNNKIAELTMNLRQTTDEDEKEELKSELQSELEAQYDSYLEQHEAPLIQLEERLAKLRKDFESRKNAKTDLVKLRLDTIWYETQGLGWPNQNSNVPVQRGILRPVEFGDPGLGGAPTVGRTRRHLDSQEFYDGSEPNRARAQQR